MKLPVMTVRLSMTANWWCWGPEVLSQLGFSGLLRLSEPLEEPISPLRL